MNCLELAYLMVVVHVKLVFMDQLENLSMDLAAVWSAVLLKHKAVKEVVYNRQAHALAIGTEGTTKLYLLDIVRLQSFYQARPKWKLFGAYLKGLISNMLMRFGHDHS